MGVSFEIVGLLAVVGICAGCGRDSAANRAVEGTWVFDASRSTFADPAQAALVDKVGPSIVYRFTPDGRYSEQPNEVEGTYRVDGHRVFLKVTRIQGIELGGNTESGQVFLGPNGTHLSIYSRDVPGEMISLAKASR